MLMGISEPTSGTCMVEGTDILQSRDVVKKFVGSCPQHDILFDWYSIEEHLRLYGVMRGIHPLDLDEAVAACLANVGLTRKKDQFVNSLSGGMRRRTSIAMATLGNPKIILLDEPSAGVDIVNRQIVWKSLVQLKKNRTIIMSTHFMEEAEILGDRVAVLKKGQLQVCGTCVELHNMFGAGYTLIINRPISGEAISHIDAINQLELAKKAFVKKAAEVMEEGEAAKIAENVARNFKEHLPPPENPILKKKIALAAQEVEFALVREAKQKLLIPEKVLEFIRRYIPDADVLEYTEEQAFLEYILPFDARDQFADTFEALEKHKGQFGFETFGVSAPTLQEVFLEISDIDNATEEPSAAAAALTSGAPAITSRRTSMKNQSNALAQRKSRRASLKIIKSPNLDDLDTISESAHAGETSSREMNRMTVEEKMEARRQIMSLPVSSAGSTIKSADQLKKQHREKRMSMKVVRRPIDDDDDEEEEEEEEEEAAKRKRPTKRGSVFSMMISGLGKMGDTKEAKRKKKNTVSSTQKYRKKKEIIWSKGVPYQSITRQMKAMVVKRYIVGKRNRKGMLLQGLLPVFIVLMGTLFFTLNHTVPSGYYTAQTMEFFDIYGDSGMQLWAPDSLRDSPFNTHVGALIDADKEITVTLDADYHHEGSDGMLYSLPSAFLLHGAACHQSNELEADECLPKLAGVVSGTYQGPDSWWQNEITYNGTNTKALPGIVNLISESWQKQVYASNPDLEGTAAGAIITASYEGFPMTRDELEAAKQPPGIGITLGILVFMSFASVMASQCNDVVGERESGCKRQQLISGVNPLAYWMSNYVFDLLFFYSIPYASTIIIVVAFDVKPYSDELGDFMTLLGFWGLASPPFAYVCSFIFAKPATAQQMMMTLNTIVALMVMGAILLLENIGGSAISTPVRFIGMMNPNVCLGLSLWTFSNEGTLRVTGDGSIAKDGMLPVYILLGQAAIYFILSIAMENTQDAAAKGYAKSKIGTMDEVAADGCQPSGPTAKSLREMTDSTKFKTFVFSMIVANMVVVVIDMGSEDVTDVRQVVIFDMLNYLFTLVFVVEMLLKLAGMGPIGYIKDPFNIFDGLLVLLSIVEIFIAGNSTFTAARTGKLAGRTGRVLKLVRLFKFARMLRILRYARFMQFAEYEVKKTSSQMMDIAKEELLRTKSSGRRESIVKRLALLGGEYVEGSAVDIERKRITRRLSRRYALDAQSRGVGPEPDEDDEAAEEMARQERGDAVAINNLIKVFERPGDLTPVTATNDIGFGVRQGEIFSLLGPNGAGKSTVLNMMTGSIAPTSGEIYVLDKNISTQFDQIKSRIGFCPQFDALVGLMNSYETLTMFARIKGIPEEDIEPLVESLVRCIGLSKHAHKMAFQYSGGNRRKLSVAIALLGNPELVFLDEPSTGMDPASLTDVYSCVWMWTRSGKNRSIVLTTHSMEEADSLSNRIGILVNGKLAVLGTSQELKSSFGRNYTFESTMGAGDDMNDRVEELKNIIERNVPGSTDDGSFEGRVRYELPQDKLKLHELFRLLESKRKELQIKDYTISQTTLEQVFIHFAQHQH